MTTNTLEIPSKTYARVAGMLYLIIAVFGAFAIGYVPSVIIANGDAALTSQNLAANLGLFKLGIVGDTVVLLAEVALTAMLYVMFKPVSATLSLIAAWARLAMVVVMAVNLLINIMPVVLLMAATTPDGVAAENLQTVAMFFFEAHALGVFVWQLFFGLHLLALGYMIIMSDLFPKLLGWMLLLGSFGYSVQGLAELTHTQNPLLTIAIIGLLVLVTLGELGFAFWLLIKGAKTA